MRLEPDKCPKTEDGKHKWSITQSQEYTHEHGYKREIGIRCVRCHVVYVESEDDLIAEFAKRRAAWRRKAWKNTRTVGAHPNG